MNGFQFRNDRFGNHAATKFGNLTSVLCGLIQRAFAARRTWFQVLCALRREAHANTLRLYQVIKLPDPSIRNIDQKF
jgi:hypothetical protein